MALFSFFKAPQNQRYAYKPRFWDPKKEEMEKRLKYLESIRGDSQEAIKQRLSGGFRGKYNVDSSVRSKGVSKSNKRLLMIIVVLLFMSYLIISVYLPQIIAMLD